MSKFSLASIMRVLNIAGAIGIAFVAIYRLVESDNSSVNEAVGSLYFIIFGMLIISAEFRLKFIERLFGFLAGQLGRGFFLILCGTLFLRSSFDVTMVIAIALIVIGVLNVIIRCKNGDQLAKYKSASTKANANPKPQAGAANSSQQQGEQNKPEPEPAHNLEEGPMIRI